MPRPLLPALAVLTAAVLGSHPAHAQWEFTTRQLAPGVYAMLPGPSPVSDSNVLVIINDDDVVVVDANILPTSARKVVAEIRKLTSKPVRYVVNTHWHSDHHYGNQVYREAWPGVEFVQHANTRRDVIARDMPGTAKNLEENYPAEIAKLTRALETGKTSTGAEVTAEMRTQFTTLKTLYETFIRDMSVTPLIPGTLTLTDSLTLYRGDRSIVVRYLGPGNTEGDLVVWLPKEQILATGDLVVLPIPFGFFPRMDDWAGTLRRLETLPAVSIMPGHGPIQADWKYVDGLIELIESTWNQTRAAAATGATLDSVRKIVNLDQFRDRFAGTDARQRRIFDYLWTTPAVEAAYNIAKPPR